MLVYFFYTVIFYLGKIIKRCLKVRLGIMPVYNVRYEYNECICVQFLMIVIVFFLKATLSVTNSTEWKPRATVETTTASSEVDEAWRNKLTQQNQNTIAVTQPTRTQSFTPVSLIDVIPTAFQRMRLKLSC